MPNSKDFVAHVLELIRPTAAYARPMFGGHGIYVDARIIGLIVDDTFYIKTDALTRATFTTAGSTPFTYGRRDGTTQATSYYSAPDGAVESAPALADWIRLGVAASLRSRSKTKEPKTGLTARRARPKAKAMAK